MNTFLKLLAGMLVITALSMSGCIDQVAVDQNGTVTIDTAEPTASIDVHQVADAEAPVEVVNTTPIAQEEVPAAAVNTTPEEINITEEVASVEENNTTEEDPIENVTVTDEIIGKALEEVSSIEENITTLEEATVDENITEENKTVDGDTTK
jgi:uncharacterized membrane protein